MHTWIRIFMNADLLGVARDRLLYLLNQLQRLLLLRLCGYARINVYIDR